MNSLFEKLNPVLQNTEDKCIIFSHFIGFIQLLRFDLQKEGVEFLIFDGSLSNKRRSEILQKFNEPSGPRILIVSIKCGGVGLNLTVANHVFLMEPWWNPAFEQQALDRVYRIGQTKQVNILKFICINTVEERIKNIQDDKMQLAMNTLTQSAQETKNNNIQNIKKIFA